jgi:hypothetical protein
MPEENKTLIQIPTSTQHLRVLKSSLANENYKVVLLMLKRMPYLVALAYMYVEIGVELLRV